MPDRLSFKYAGAAFLVAVSVGSSSPAMAGFQWVAPSDAVSAPPMVMQQAPMVTSAPEVISPVVITGSAPAQVVTAPAPAAVAPAPVVAAPAPAVMAPQVVVAPPPAVATPQVVAVTPQGGDGAPVVGFAHSVPLAVALRQILPTGYAFSIDQDVDMGTLVSFQGGRGWRETLRDALSPVGLVMHERGQMVAVGYAAHDAMLPARVAAVPVPVAPAPGYQVGAEPRVLMAPPGAAPAPVAMAPAVGMGAVPGPAVATDSWTAERGETLRKVLEGWSHRANVEFDWFSEYDYPLEASVAFSGGFEGAVRNLLTGFEGAHPQPVAELHSNTNLGQMVLVVQTRGNTNSD